MFIALDCFVRQIRKYDFEWNGTKVRLIFIAHTDGQILLIIAYLFLYCLPTYRCKSNNDVKLYD